MKEGFDNAYQTEWYLKMNTTNCQVLLLETYKKEQRLDLSFQSAQMGQQSKIKIHY